MYCPQCPCIIDHTLGSAGVMDQDQAEQWMARYREKYGHTPRVTAVRAVNWRGELI